MAAPDVRGLVPMEPPEGLLGWTLRHDESEEMSRGALVYEIEWEEGRQMYDILDEWAKPKKEKLVRVRCSCCGTSTLCDYAKALDGRKYGFVNIYADEDGIEERTSVYDGDDTVCPICGEPVRAFRAAGIGYGHKLIGETFVLSAAVVGAEKLLALTLWSVQSRAYRAGSVGYKIQPAEACVFGRDFEANLRSWRNNYSGTAGYFMTYLEQWSQPKSKQDAFSCEDVYGLTGALVEASCLPNCKLDVYMKSRPGAVHYPAEYMRLYRRHPNVEALLLHGLPRVLDAVIRTAVLNNVAWADCGIDWRQTRPAQMLGLTREELRLGQRQGWGKWSWDLFTGAKRCGERLTAEDMTAAFELGDEGLLDIPGHGPVARSIRYLRRQIEVTAVDIDDAGADPIPDAGMLLDYWRMAGDLGRDLNEQLVRWPDDLIGAHDEMAAQADRLEDKTLIGQFRQRRRQLRHYSFAADGLIIRAAGTQKELIAEGDVLHHCVATYAKRHASGETAIFFIRRASQPGESYYTLELDETKLRVRQNRGLCNCGRTPEVQAFEEKWLTWVQAGAPRGRDGKPVLPRAPADRRAA